jgi:DNA-binding transcriptional LysR family regulator
MLDSLRALNAIVETGSFAEAAKKLHKTQSAISYAVKKLEEELGVELFDRSGHRAELTQAGLLVLEEGRSILAGARRLEGLAAQLQEGWEPSLDLILDGIVPLEPVLAALKRLADEGVPTRIQLKTEFLWGAQYRFETENADLMLVKNYRARDHYVVRPLPEVTAVLCTSPNHELAAFSTVELRELHNHVELSIQDSSDADMGEDTTAFGGPRVYYLSDFRAKRVALLMGLGFGWVPHYLVADDLKQGTLVEVPYDRGSRYSFQPLLVHRDDRPPGKTARRLIELL